MKKVLSLILSILLIASVVPMGLFTITASATTSGYYTYTVSNGNATITDVDTSISGAVTIPSNLGGYPVTRIGDWAFSGCTSLTSITIPDSVTSIGNRAFLGCSSLMSITIPDSVTSIGDWAFSGCSKLESITLPFVGSSRKASGSYDAVFGYIFGSTSSYSTGTTKQYYSSGSSYYYIPSSLRSVTITDATQIPYGAFYNCSMLTSVTIGDSVTSIGGSAFYECSSLTSITIPDSVTSIGGGAFRGCSKLESITLPFVGSSRTASGSYDAVFGYIFEFTSSNSTGTTKQYFSSAASYYYYIPSSLRSVTITDATQIPYGAFYNCSMLTSVTVPDSVTSISYVAFSGCSSLTSITVDSANKHYSSQDGVLFNKDKTQLIQYPIGKASTTYTVPDSVTSIGDGAFSGYSSLTSITIPDSVTNIGGSAFEGCSSLTSITIPDSVTNIGGSAFSGCSSLTSITIPDSVTSIGEAAFIGCSKLESITLPFVGATPDGIRNTHFGYIFGANFYSSNKNYVPLSLKEVIITASCKSIGGSAFYGCTWLTSITIPGSVTSIGGSAFYECSSLTSITIPDSVTSIGKGAFYRCTSLTSITIPDSVTNIGDSAFEGCTSLESITLPFVGQNADGTGFSNFGYIFGANNESYPYFDNAEFVPNSLRNVTITGSNAIAENAFYGCNYLQTVNFVGNVKILGDWVFGDCTGLKKVTLPVSCKKIGAMSFYDCLNLEDVYFLGTEGQKNIEIYHGNDMLEDVATWHYKSCYGSDQHSYSDGVICSVCGALKYTPGDLTGDDKINSLDGLMLLRHLNGWTLNIASPEAMDVNADGKVNSLDGLMLMRYLNGWNITLG